MSTSTDDTMFTSEGDAVTNSGARETTEGRVYTVTGGDFRDGLAGGDPIEGERMVLNMGPQHPSTHGVLRLVLELEGETVTQCRLVIGYLHTGIEKNVEFRTWTQAVTFLTRSSVARSGASMPSSFSTARLYAVSLKIGDR